MKEHDPGCNIFFGMETHGAPCNCGAMTLVESHVEYADVACIAANERIRALEQEIADAMEVLQPSMPESGLVDACRQVKQALISHAENSEVFERRLIEAERRIHGKEQEQKGKEADGEQEADASSCG